MNKDRIQRLNDDGPDAEGTYVLYWMQQSQRAHANPALEHAVLHDRASPRLQPFRIEQSGTAHPGAMGVTVAATDIIQTHILMLDDSTFREGTERRIEQELCNAEWALQSQLEEVLTEFRGMNDEYIRTRGEDVKQVVRLVQSRLNEETATQVFEELPDRLAETLTVPFAPYTLYPIPQTPQ